MDKRDGKIVFLQRELASVSKQLEYHKTFAKRNHEIATTRRLEINRLKSYIKDLKAAGGSHAAVPPLPSIMEHAESYERGLEYIRTNKTQAIYKDGQVIAIWAKPSAENNVGDQYILWTIRVSVTGELDLEFLEEKTLD